MSANSQRKMRRKGKSSKLSPNISVPCFDSQVIKKCIPSVSMNNDTTSLRQEIATLDDYLLTDYLKDSCNDNIQYRLENKMDYKMNEDKAVEKKDNHEALSCTPEEVFKANQKLYPKRNRQIRATINNLCSPWMFEGISNIKVKPRKIKKKPSSVLLQVDDILEEKKRHSPSDNKENETTADTSDTEHYGTARRKRNLRKKKVKNSHFEKTDSQESDFNYWSVQEGLPAKPKTLRRKRNKFRSDNENFSMPRYAADSKHSENNSSDGFQNSSKIDANTSISSEICHGYSEKEERISPAHIQADSSQHNTSHRRGTFEIKRILNKEMEDNPKDAVEFPEKLRRKTENVPLASKIHKTTKKNDTTDNTRMDGYKKVSTDEGNRNADENSEYFPSNGHQFGVNQKSCFGSAEFTKESTDSDNVFTDSNTSMEVSFKKKSNRESEILDHLNVTRLESRKSSFKKSTRGFSTGTDDENDKMRFITFRKGNKTLADWDTDTVQQKTNFNANRRGNFKGSLPLSRDPASSKVQESSTKQTSQKKSPRSIVVPDSQIENDLFNLIANNSKENLDDVDSLVLVNSFTNDGNYPTLERGSTFIKEDSITESLQLRKSTRRRWSKVEKTPIFNSNPQDILTPGRKRDVNNSKSVLIITPPKVSSKHLQTLAVVSPATKEPKRQKSVRIESPLNSPKMQMHSPLVIRKTPGPKSTLSNNSCSYIFGKSPSSNIYPPSNTSTPFSNKKELGLLKKVLVNGKTKGDSVMNHNNSKRIKMPNFEKIHQRQFEKMENLEELQRRKAMRAQFLLSGSKPPASQSLLDHIEKESRKKLQFSPLNKAQTSNQTIKEKPLPKPVLNMMKKRASLEKKKRELKSKLPIRSETVKPATTQAPTSRFGLKLPEKQAVSKQEQIRAIVAKTKVAPNRREESRKQLQGVRSNRRFDLLMKMRQNQK